MRWILFGLTALLCHAQQDVLPPDLQLLAKVKNRIAANLSRLPNYTCVQTIERSYRRSTNRKFEPLDTVRLEVALVEGRELFGWPGGDRIAESEISNLVRGTIGNGDFALLAKSIFLTSSATFHYAGDATLEGRTAIKFDYRVPLLASGYHLKVPPQEAVVPYHGSFWVEPATLDLLRLELAVDDIPAYLGLSAATNSTEYSRVDIGGSPFLLPQNAELTMIENNGAESRNRTRFGACRQFTGESVLSFANNSSITSEAAPKPAVQEIDLPEEFTADLSLETPIDSANAAVGDAIKAKLRHNLKMHRAVLIPKGAELTGHIARLERSNRTYILEIAVTAIDFDGGHANLSGRDNLVWAPVSVREFRTGAGHAYDRSFTIATDSITIPTDHLKLSEGARLNLRSRLVQSEQ